MLMPTSLTREESLERYAVDQHELLQNGMKGPRSEALMRMKPL